MSSQQIWNYGDILDILGERLGTEQPALIHGEHIVSWPEMNARSNNLARNMLDNGAKPGDKVGFYMYNRPEYMEGLAACFKARLTHVNVNYRYVDEELFYILDNSDATCVFYDPAFRENILRLHTRLSKIHSWIETSNAADRPDFALSYEALAAEGKGEKLDVQRSGDDLFLLYTGGTTGMPKGVMWPHHTHRLAQLDTLKVLGPVPETMEQHLAFSLEAGHLARQIPACPLMHGTGMFTALGTMMGGGAVVTLPGQGGFDAQSLWQAVDRHGVTSMAIVGDAFAKPMLEVLKADPERYNVSSVESIISSGVMWSTEIKRGLIEFMPQAAMLDSFGASEAIGFGSSIMTSAGETQTAKFAIGEHCKVFSEDGREIQLGSDEPGFIARAGTIPLGYYKDEEKTAKTFKMINGVRYSVPGDWCIVAEDGTLTLLGRGSICINTAGEKVYPEEVEEALKTHELVEDALVVGLEDDKWGQAVTAVVALIPGQQISEAELRDYTRTRLAGYKLPKRILFKADLGRAPNGKADYGAIRDYALTMI